MMSKGTFSVVLTLVVGLSQGVRADGFLSNADLDWLDCQRFWHGQLPIPPGEYITRATLLDDNLYLLASNNIAYAVHTGTGVIRWTAAVAEPGQTVRGPTHSRDHVLFTTPAAVRVFNRRTGELIGEPRRLRGVIIEVHHDTATISIGRVHGVRGDQMLDVYVGSDQDNSADNIVAKVRITVVKERKLTGRIIRSSRRTKVVSGYRVKADIQLPLEEVKLPFAASSAAVADKKDLFVGAANQRLYSIRTLTGFENWRVMAPDTLSSTPVILGDDLFFGDQSGRIVSCTKVDRTKNWVFKTEGPIFTDIVVSPKFVYATSNDRLLYCLDRKRGGWVWRERFRHPPAVGPVLSDSRIYQEVPDEGLFVFDAKTGKKLWNRAEGGTFLSKFGKDAYLAHKGGSVNLLRVDAETGKSKSVVPADGADFVAASNKDKTILLASRSGQMVCLRPKNAPRLEPAQLAAVLANDRAATELARAGAARAAKRLADKRETEPKPITVNLDFLDDDDWLTSSSDTKPVGGKGLVEVADEGGADVARGAEEADEEEDDEDEDDEDEDDEDDEDEDDEDEDDEDEEEEEDDEDEDDEDEEEDDEDEDDEDEEEEEDDEDEDDEDEEEDDEDEDDEDD